MRDTKVLESFKKKVEKKLKEMNVLKSMRQEVNTGANGTQDYVTKQSNQSCVGLSCHLATLPLLIPFLIT